MVNSFSYTAIPATDFDRAFQFYHKLTIGKIYKNLNVPFPMAYFKDDNGNDIGHLFQLPNFKPSADGTIVYFEIETDMEQTLGTIESAGGKILMQKTLIAPGKGYWSMFLDTEGNKLALHSNS